MGGRGALSTEIRPLGAGLSLDTTIAGPALTADCGPAEVLATLAALAFIQPGDVLVIAADGHQGAATMGDRVAGMAKNQGAVAAVTDGPVRDFAGLAEVGLPVWCTGLNPATPFESGPGAVGHPVQLGGRSIATGDMIVADRDGVVVVPFAQIDAVIDRLATVRQLEAELDAKIRDGQGPPPAILELLKSDRVTYD